MRTTISLLELIRAEASQLTSFWLRLGFDLSRQALSTLGRIRTLSSVRSRLRRTELIAVFYLITDLFK